jgi:hypothetical protein
MGHLTGTALKPKNPADGKSAGWSPTADEIKEIQTYEKENAEWLEKDAVVKQQIVVVIPDSLFIRLLSKTMAKEYYDTLKALFEKRSLVVGVELRRQLREMRLKESGDAQEHLETIMGIREQLASMGKPVANEDLFNMIFVSLPRSYNGILTSVATTIKLHQQSLTTDDLMGLILDEYDRLKLQAGAKSNAKGEDTAYSTDDKARGKARSRSPMTCFNCGWEGHKKENCWEEGGSKENEAPERWKPRGKKDKASKDETPKSDSTKANTATKKYEPDAVWLAMAADAGEIDDWLVEDEEDTLEITAPQLQAQEDIVKAPDSAALSQSCTAAERAIVE